MNGSVWRAWDRFLLYFPLVSMGGLAFGSYWLVQSTAVTSETVMDRPIRHDPDYFLHEFSLRTFDAQGRVTREVRGDKATHFPDRQQLEIQNVHIHAVDASGRSSVATAQQGLSNEDASEIQLIGNAVMVREARPDGSSQATPRIELRSQFLHVFVQDQRVRSYLPVELLHGQDRFQADVLDYDSVELQLLLRGRVRATLEPNQTP